MSSRRRDRNEFEDKDSSHNSSQNSGGSSARRSRASQKKVEKERDKCDRFIPNRGAMNAAVGNFEMSKENIEDNSEHVDRSNSPLPRVDVESNDALNQALESSIVGESGYVSSSSESSVESGGERVLAFRKKAPLPSEGHINSLKVLYSQAPSNVRGITHSAKLSRHVSSTPERMLDAPGLVDDYYLNLVSWGNNNLLGVALGPVVYLWNPVSGQIIDIPSLEDDDKYVGAVSFSPGNANLLGVGTSTGKTQIWDVSAQKQVREMDGHINRVSSMSWNRSTLTTGGKDSHIIHHDVRISNHAVSTLAGHSQEVCALYWSPSGTVLASGANDNKVNLWEASVLEGFYQSAPRVTMTDHQAAVKAMAWCPFEHNLLATGAGTADRTIKFWNSSNGSLLNSIDTGTQVCALQWSTSEKELLSSHGFGTNSLCLWKYPSMTKVKELKGHTKRVLHMAQSPEGQMVVSAAADETLRFWNVFASPIRKAKKKAPSKLSNRNIGIR